MTNKISVTSVLNVKATAELIESVSDDMLKTDGSLKDLLDDTNQSPSDQESNSSRITRE